MGIDALRLTIEREIEDCVSELLALEKGPDASRSAAEIVSVKQRLSQLCADLSRLGDAG